MENDNCVEVIIIQGEAGKISEIYKNIVKNKGINPPLLCPVDSYLNKLNTRSIVT